MLMRALGWMWTWKISNTRDWMARANVCAQGEGGKEGVKGVGLGRA